MRSSKASCGRVAILGAGLPGLILARELVDAGHDVDLFGRKEAAGVLSGMGPRHLWDCEAFKDEETAHDGLPQAQRETILVRFLMDDLMATPPHSAYMGYWTKSRGTTTGRPPCRGVTQFNAIVDGFALLAKVIDAGQFEAVVQPVVELAEKTQGWMVRLDGGKICGPYDRVVNTLSPQKFSGLMPEFYVGSKIPMAQKIKYYWTTREELTSSIRVMVGKHDGHEILIYSGDPDLWWHRMSSTHRGWCFESSERRGPKPSIWKGECAEAYTQIVKFDGEFAYPPGVTPVGRFAEWDGEAMVDTVYARRKEYVATLEAAKAKSWRLVS